MRILIVGGNSSTGIALRALLSEFYDVITAGRKDCDIELDLEWPIEKIIIPKEVDVIIHTSANFGGVEDQRIFDAENINVLGTLKLCQASAQSNVKHFVLISSIFARQTEQSTNSNIYSISKRHSEEIARFYCELREVPLTILRPSQLYGNSETFRKHQPFFYNIVDKAERGEDIQIYGSNDPLRNFLHVEDLIEIIFRVIKLAIKGTYSCTHPSDVTFSEIASAAYSAFRTKGEISFVKEKENIADNIFPKENALYEAIGFYPRISITEGMGKLANSRFSGA